MDLETMVHLGVFVIAFGAMYLSFLSDST